MEGNWRPTQSAVAEGSLASSIDSAGAGGDWRSQLQPEARLWIVNKIMETLKRHLPISDPEGTDELRKIAIWREEKIYTAATSRSDYLRMISPKMLSTETKNPPAAPINPGMPNPAAVNQNPIDPGSIGTRSQPNNPGQPLPVHNRQSILCQNLQNNTSAAVQGFSGMAPTLPPISGLGQSNISSVTHASNLQTMSGISQSSVNNSIAQRAQPGRQQQQQIISQHQQQQQSQNLLLYQQQLQQQLLNRKLQHSSLLQHPQQQQQQSLLQPNQTQSTQASLMQMSSSLQQKPSNIQQTQPASTHMAPQPGFQQNELNQIQQYVPSLLQNPSISRQQHVQSLHQQAPSAQQQSTPIPQQSTLSHQQRMMGQQGNMSNMQQNHNMADIQQQRQRLQIQQNNLLSMQHQRLMNQQTLNLQQQQLGSQSNMSGLQHQQLLLGSLPSVSNIQPHQQALMMQKNAAQQQQQHQQQQQLQQQQQQQLQNQQSSLLLHSQGPQSQNQSSQQQLMSQYQSQPSQLQQQFLKQQQSNSLQREMQQRLQSSGPILQTQKNPMEQKPSIQAPTLSVESTAQTGHTGSIDWQEECYQKVKSMKELYFAELTEFHQEITLKLQQQEALVPPGKQSEQHEKLKGFRQMLERMLALLQINKNNIPFGLKDKLPLYEKQILSMVASNRAKKASPQVQGRQQFQHPNAGNAQPIIPQQRQSQSMEVSEPASMEVSEPAPFQAVQEEPSFNCPICMCVMVSPFTTVCGHIFCEDCIKAATKKHKKCPTCRSKLTGRNNIHRVFLPNSD